MSKYSAKTEFFFSGCSLGGVTRNLAEALIEMLGGEQKFIDNATGYNWWTLDGLDDQCIAFYDKHKDELLVAAQFNANENRKDNSLIEWFAAEHYDNQEIDLDRISSGLYDAKSEHYDEMAAGMTRFISKLLYSEYDTFSLNEGIEFDENAV